MTIKYNKTLKKYVHYCGDGFKSVMIEARGVKFCYFCGMEARK